MGRSPGVFPDPRYPDTNIVDENRRKQFHLLIKYWPWLHRGLIWSSLIEDLAQTVLSFAAIFSKKFDEDISEAITSAALGLLNIVVAIIVNSAEQFEHCYVNPTKSSLQKMSR